MAYLCSWVTSPESLKLKPTTWFCDVLRKHSRCNLEDRLSVEDWYITRTSNKPCGKASQRRSVAVVKPAGNATSVGGMLHCYTPTSVAPASTIVTIVSLHQPWCQPLHQPLLDHYIYLTILSTMVSIVVVHRWNILILQSFATCQIVAVNTRLI